MNPGKKDTRGGAERRRSPRVKLEQTVRIRPANAERPLDLQKTRDISRTGFYFTTASGHYYMGMRVYATIGYKADDPVIRESLCEVVRLERLAGEKWGVAVHIVIR